ncbi:amidohydrolase family protein [Lacihabitans sp. LS3-19]|uniref:metal-dependent hydrolase family protein n=1 Tax=Lacihabitans sp. LS3-19 TaxID=2487335 RepID=UPI0020CD1EE9|nr:amidohydrolase family protein [Lacihabitans sp. LS3-19]MCP9767214.1 amidohydrolase family protein [Lacihabitans sp. LS3-19]
MKLKILILLILNIYSQFLLAQNYIFLKPDRVFDGEKIIENAGVLVKDNKIEKYGLQNILEKNLPPNTKVIDLKGKTLLPGLIEGHSHLFLHPYNETAWNDQVLEESRSYRTARAVKHAENTLLAGFTTVRDLGTEGSEYDDVGLKKAIEDGIILGPRMLIATKALIATGSYGPKGFSADIEVPQGAEQADGHDNLTKAVRTQIGKGADLIKVYADYRWGLRAEAMPTFTLDELKLIVEIAKSSGRPVVAHASTPEGMRRAILAGIETIEHGDGGTPEIWKMMKEKDVCFCPTLAAGDAISQYRGWKKGIDPEPERIIAKRKSFEEALKYGVKICMGGDVGVYPHGDNAREIEMMVEYGMSPLEVLKSSTSINAKVFHIDDQVGKIQQGLLADIIAIEGNPIQKISDIRNIQLVIKDGKVILEK